MFLGGDLGEWMRLTDKPATCQGCLSIQLDLPNIRHPNNPLVHLRYYNSPYGIPNKRWSLCKEWLSPGEVWVNEPVTCLACLGHAE